MWYGEWRGHPQLQQSPQLMQLDRLSRAPAVAPLVPQSPGNTTDGAWPRYAADSLGPNATRMACVREHVLKVSVFDGYDLAWAARETVGHAQLYFDLHFDRNTWLPAQAMAYWWGADSIPGLDYPSPGPMQLKWMSEDLLDDLRDVAGDQAATRTWRIVVLGVESGDVPPPNSSCLLPPPVLPMRIRIRADLSPVRLEAATTRRQEHGLRQRGRSAGAVVQRIAATLRG